MKLLRSSIVFLTVVFLSTVVAADPAPAPPADSALATPEGLVHELYRMVCVPVGGDTDWEQVRALFLPEAVIVMRPSRKEGLSTFTLQGWIDDFVAFNQKAKSSERGFEEKIVRMSPVVFRDVAHVFVLYEARMLDWTRPAQQGVDSIELVRKDGRWWVAAITNDIPDADNPIPAELKE